MSSNPEISTGAEKKRISLTLHHKLDIIEELENGVSPSEITKKKYSIGKNHSVWDKELER